MEYSTEQEQFWAGSFGDDYTERNTGKQMLASNIAFFAGALRRANKIRNCLELGANRGMNLLALGGISGYQNAGGRD